MASGFALFDSSLHVHLQPIGLYLFLGGWVIIMGAVFGTGMEKVIDLPPPTRIQKWISRGSIVGGIALNTIAWAFFTTSPETWGEQARVGKPHPLRVVSAMDIQNLTQIRSGALR